MKEKKPRSEKQRATEKHLRPFKKGNTASIGKGRPKGHRNITSILKEMLTKQISYKDAILNKQVTMTVAEAITNNLLGTSLQAGKEETRLKATDMILDRLEGQPKQFIDTKEVPTTNEEAIEQLKKIAAQEGISIQELCDREGIELPE